MFSESRKLACVQFAQMMLKNGLQCSAGSFDQAVKGADYVFHTASPFVAGAPEDPEAFFVKPAVEGTKNVLSSVLKSKGTVKRVVLTSSFAGELYASCRCPIWCQIAYSACG